VSPGARFDARPQEEAVDRAYRKKGPPDLWLRASGPLVVVSTVIVFVSGILLLLEGPKARGGLLLIHKASFLVWLVLTALHVLGHLGDVARFASVRSKAERVPRTTGRTVLLVATLAVGLAIAVLPIPDFAAWTSHGLGTHFGEH
jgi:hypothetical protein